MVSIKPVFIAIIGLCALSFSACCAEQKQPEATPRAQSDVWFPMVETDWAVYMDAPSYHFALAKEYLQLKEYSKASSELKLGNSFLIFQKDRLSVISKQVEDLSNSMLTSKGEDTSELNAVTLSALNVINNKYAMVPVDVGATAVFEYSYKYHFDRAKSELGENDRSKAALDIRKAASFMKLKAAYTRHFAKTELDSTVSEMKTLASRVESGTVKDAKELDKAFQKAINVFSKKKE
jgi:hypothetical protein